MTLAWQAARIVAVTAALLIGWNLLPNASAFDSSPLTIPSVIWNPLVAVLQLNRYFPVETMLRLALLTIGIGIGLAGWWLVSWVTRHVLGS